MITQKMIIDEDKVLNIIQDILNALVTMHQRKEIPVAHRDLKVSVNFLI
jgi:serine/threonine protein kinase